MRNCIGALRPPACRLLSEVHAVKPPARAHVADKRNGVFAWQPHGAAEVAPALALKEEPEIPVPPGVQPELTCPASPVPPPVAAIRGVPQEKQPRTPSRFLPHRVDGPEA